MKLFLAIALCAAFLIGSIAAFSKRFESGNLYPDYSTHRTSPTGCHALYNALAKIGTISVSRIDGPTELSKLEADDQDLLFLIGTHPGRSEKAGARIWQPLDDLLESGATVVLGLKVFDQFFPTKPTEEETERAPAEAGLWLESKGLRYDLLSFKEAQKILEREGSGEFFTATPDAPWLSEPIELSKLVALEFEADSEWIPLYSIGDRAIGAELPVGKGRLIVLSDSYPFSNEALAYRRASEFFSSLLQGKRSVRFVELQLGVLSGEGIVSLARRHGFTLALILAAVAAVAFAWSSSFSKTPRLPAGPMRIDASGADRARSGTINLMQDSLPKKELIRTAFLEWRSSVSNRRIRDAELTEAENIARDHAASSIKSGDIASAYNRIRKILNKN